jgi:hypothetical protein
MLLVTGNRVLATSNQQPATGGWSFGNEELLIRKLDVL